MQQPIIFDKERSIKACVADAWRIFAINWRLYIKSTWVYLLLAGLSQAFLLEMTLRIVCHHALPALRLSQSGGDAHIVQYLATPDVFSAIYWLLALIICLVCTYYCKARNLSLIGQYRESNALSAKLPLQLSHLDRHYALRLFVIDLLFFVVTLIVAVAIIGGAVKFSSWIALLLPLLIIYICVTAKVANLQNTLLGKSVKKTLRFALRHSMGQLFIVQLLTFIPAALLWLIFSLPAIIYVCGTMAGNDSLLRDDGLGLPDMLPLIFFIINALCFAVVMLIGAQRTWALAMKK